MTSQDGGLVEGSISSSGLHASCPAFVSTASPGSAIVKSASDKRQRRGCSSRIFGIVYQMTPSFIIQMTNDARTSVLVGLDRRLHLIPRPPRAGSSARATHHFTPTKRFREAKRLGITKVGAMTAQSRWCHSVVLTAVLRGTTGTYCTTWRNSQAARSRLPDGTAWSFGGPRRRESRRRYLYVLERERGSRLRAILRHNEVRRVV